MEKIKVLAIAPYPEFEKLIIDAAGNFEQIELYTFQSFYKNAIEYIKAFPYVKFDIIISRGGTAALLKELVDVPVVEVEISTFDVLRVMLQALQQSGHIAVVSFPYVTSKVEKLSRILRMDVFSHTIESIEELPAALAVCKTRGIELVIGGAATQSETLAAGFQFILLTSSFESVEDSLRRAIERFKVVSSVLRDNRIFHTIVENSTMGVLIFDNSLHIRYANKTARQIKSDVPRLEYFFNSYIPPLREHGSTRFIKKFSNDYYNVQGNIVEQDGTPYYYFYIQFLAKAYHTAPFTSIENVEDIQLHMSQAYFGSVYMRPLLRELSAAAATELPVLIQGAVGTKKGLIARHIHTKSENAASSFIRIRCKEITVKNWTALLKNITSPIHSTSYTVFFENINELSLATQDLVATYIEDTRMSRRHKLISSSQHDLSELVAERKFSHQLYSSVNAFTVNIPPLCQRGGDIPAIANLMISKINSDFSNTVIGIDPDAMDAFCKFSWPLNLTQMEKALRQMVASSDSYYISAEMVGDALRNEAALQNQSEEGVDMCQTLEKIERQIILKVLQQENSNQSVAAKRLGISRSTLWRKLSQ